MMRWIVRLAPLLSGVLLLLAGTLLISRLTGQANPMDGSALVGTDLGGRSAPSFRLADARGDIVSLASLRGRAVALTFIYTSCPDLCPVTAEKLRYVYDQLGSDADKVAMVGITVDPETDTPPRMEEYTQEMQLAGKWEFLTSSRALLSPVWSAYAVAPLSSSQAGLLVAQGSGVAGSDAGFDQAHTLAVYVIDPQGREQRLLSPDFAPSDLTHDLEALVARSSH